MVFDCGRSSAMHRSTFLLSASAPIHLHGSSSSFFPFKKAASFITLQKFSSSSPSLHATTTTATATRRRGRRQIEISQSQCCSQKRIDLNGLQVEVEVEVGGPLELEDFLVVSFYRFVLIKDPEIEVSKHLSFLQGRDIHGRIYVNEQGINAQYSGPSKDALAYAEWVKDDRRFSDILVQTSPALNGHAFPRLKLRYKPSLVQFEGGTLHLPLLDPSLRASPLAPSEWRKRLEVVNEVDIQSEKEDSVHNRKFLLLDVRNGYEWDIGHFQGANRPDVDCFRGTSFGLSDQENQVADTDPLAGIDKENTDILMYCTGGIRCDVYSTILRQRGFQNVYTLSGGISHYLEREGSSKWIGNLFVFDSRLSLPPSTYNPGGNAKVRSEKVCQNEERHEMGYQNGTFARCYICSSQLTEFRHRNCANLDCNRLILSCTTCIRELRGCCCLDCANSPRLRPVLPGNQRYQKWHLYRDGVFPQQL